MAYLIVGLLAGLAATPHCLGMCGPFPLHLGRAGGRGRPVLRPLLYLSGKTFTYAFLGLLAAAAGARLVHARPFDLSQDLLAYLSGGLLAGAGLVLLGVGPRRLLALGAAPGRFLSPLYRHFLHAPGPGPAFLLGVLTGYLPCPITLALLAAAAGTHSPPAGLALLLGLGIGTAPGLFAVGLSSALLPRWRRAGTRAAGALVLLLGLITLLRPTGILCRFLPISESLFPPGLW